MKCATTGDPSPLHHNTQTVQLIRT